MKAINCPNFLCHVCFDNLIGTINEDKTVTFEHKGSDCINDKVKITTSLANFLVDIP